MKLGLVDEDEEVRAPADRGYWEKRGSKQTLAMMDETFGWLHDLDPGLELKYNKFYVGLAENGRSNLFVLFRPQKVALMVEDPARTVRRGTGATRCGGTHRHRLRRPCGPLPDSASTRPT